MNPKSEFTKNVLTLMTGSIIAQAIPIAISPILTRIYTPKDFGIFALYMSVASIFTTFATGRYELAIMLPKKAEDAANLLFLSLLITVLITCFSLGIVVVFNDAIVTFLGNADLSNWLYFIPLSVLFTGLYQSFNYWHNRQKEYRSLAVSRVAQSAVTGTTNLSMGFGGLGSFGLVLGNLFGLCISVFMLGKQIVKYDKKMFVCIRKIKCIALMKKYKKFPLLNLPNAVIDSFRLSGISMLIAKYFSTATLGQFSLAWKMVQVPMALIGASLGQVFFQKVSSISKAELYSIIIKYIQKASLIAAPIFLLVYFFSEYIFGFVFGKDWILAGEAASVMAPWLFINFVSSPLVSVMLVLNKQEYVLLFSLFYMAVPLGLIILMYDNGFISVLSVITIAMSMMLLSFSAIILIEAKRAGR